MIHALLLALAAAPASGVYGPLKLAFAGGRVLGAFFETRAGNGTDAAPQFSCAFHLNGAWAGDHAAVLTWWPSRPGDPDERIPGRLTLTGDRVSLKLRDNPGGCDMTGEDFKGAPFETTLDVAHPGWIGFREVRSARARFHAAPGGAAGPSYVVRGDDVAVAAARPGWVDAEYVDGRKFVRGWIAEGDLYPAAP